MKIRKSSFIFGIFLLIFSFLYTQPVSAQLTQGEKDTILIGRLQIQPSVKEMAAKQSREVELNNVAESWKHSLLIL